MVFLGKTRRIHFVGIGGIGMSGIAEVLLNLGFEVSGSDLKRSDLTENLEKLGASIHYGHRLENVIGSDVVVYSSAVRPTNPEVLEAGKREIPTIPRTEMLAELMRLKVAVTVAGAHGKTSTTSLVSAVLAEGGLDPTIVVGGKLKALRTNARLGAGRYLVAEADESDGKFVQLPSTVAVITNIDLEHLDFYPDLEAIKAGFVEYANRVPFYGSVILCVDDANVRAIMPMIKRRKLTYSLGGEADISGEVLERDETGCRFSVSNRGRGLGEVHLAMPGDHYARNALAAVAVGLELELPFASIKKGLESFEGVGRRFEVKGVASDVMVVDDYGHHPTEIAATIRAAQKHIRRRLIVMFQPHRFTRTQALAEQFGSCFRGAHLVFISEIYPAGETPIPGVTSDSIVAKVQADGGVEVRRSGTVDEMIEEVLAVVEKGDLILTLGAGDISKAGEILLERLNGRDL